MQAPSPLHVVCPHCAATNRIPGDRFVQRPADGARIAAAEARCGSCHRALFDGHPAAVDAAAFDKHRRGNDIPMLVDVWAPWCGPCRMMAPMFERAAAQLEPHMRLVKVNADEEPAIAAQLGASSIPALFLMRGGRVIARTAGAMDTPRIVNWVRGQLASAA